MKRRQSLQGILQRSPLISGLIATRTNNARDFLQGIFPLNSTDNSIDTELRICFMNYLGPLHIERPNEK